MKMGNVWITIFDQSVNGRTVKIETHIEGGYKATTTALKDYPGNLIQTDSEIIIMPPDGAGYIVEWEDDDLQDLCNELLKHDFTEADVQLIYDTCFNNSKL